MGSPLSRIVVESVALALTAVTLTALCLIPNASGSFHDDGIYVATAKSLAEGNGYRLGNLPGAPIQTKYPIGYPALLALCWRVWPAFPDNLVLMHAATISCAGAAVGLFHAYLVRFGYASRFAAASGCLLCATSPVFVFFAGRLLSEMPFALLFVSALWTFDDLLRSPGASRRRRIVSGVVLAAPLLCRSAGIAPIAVFALAGLRRRSLRWTYPGMAAVVLPWLAWTALNRGEAARNPILGYYTDYLGWWTSAAPRATAAFLVTNASYLVVSIPVAIFGTDLFAKIPIAAGSTLATMLGLTALAGLASSRGGLRLGLVSYLALIWIWPWPPLRFEVPVAPILAAVGLDLAAKGLRRFLPARPATIVGLVLLAAAVAANLAAVEHQHRTARLAGYSTLGAAPPGSWSRFERLFGWIRTRTEPDAVIASGLDPMLALYTGRPAFRPFAARPLELFYGQPGSGLGSVEDLERSLRVFHARYLIRLPLVGYAEEAPFDRLIQELRRRDPGLLRPVYTDDDGRFVVYRIQAKDARSP